MKLALVVKHSFVKSFLLRISFGIILIFLAAQVQIPLKPVPVTLQTTAVLIIALCYSKKEALAVFMGYLTLGAFDVPVFAGLSGASKFYGPTAGYLAGMMLCIYLVTTLREKFGDDNSFFRLFVYGLLGMASVYVVGVPYLFLFVGDKALELGLFPFIIPGLVKSLFTTYSVKIIRQI